MRKKDEMELEISNKSLKITWFVTVMVLFIIGIIERFNTGEQNIFMIIATLSVVLYIGLERYFLSKVNEDRSFVKFIVGALILTAILLLIVWWVS